MYIILKLKSILKTVTKEMLPALIIMILGFILISAIFIIKYKPVYEVKVANQILGYVEDKGEFENMIKENILNKKGNNIESIVLGKEPEYEKKYVVRKIQTNQEEILEELNKQAVTTYKFYAVTLNNKDKAYVDTLKEAEKVVKKIKKEYKGNSLKLNLAINERYTENKKEVNTDTTKVAETSMEKEIKKILDKREAKKAIATIKGIKLAVLPVSGRISSRFGAISSIRSGAHTGLDIACATGTNIKVVSKGTVVHAGRRGPYGNLIKVDHGNNIQTWYAHCSKIYVKEGQKVKAKDVIGAVGATGNATGPHLHLEIRIKGVAVNPQKYLYK